MTIGFDVSQAGGERKGCGQFALQLVRALIEIAPRDDFVLYPQFGDVHVQPDPPLLAALPQARNVRVRRGRRDPSAERNFWREPAESLERELGRPDIVHANNWFCPAGLGRAKLVYTLYDLSFLEQPDCTTEANRTACFGGVFQAALRADGLLAISEFTRKRFLEHFPHISPEKVATIGLGSRFESDRLLPRPGRLDRLTPGRFWLTVGTLEPRKNYARLVEAYRRLHAGGQADGPLVIAGGEGWLMEDFRESIRDLEEAGQLILAGFVADEELQWLYQNCFCFVFPSLYEGFGLPLLEAMALGAPAIAANVCSLPEIAGDAALLVDPSSAEEIASAMESVRADPQRRSRMAEQGLRRAQTYSWRSAAAGALEMYRRVLRSPERAVG